MMYACLRYNSYFFFSLNRQRVTGEILNFDSHSSKMEKCYDDEKMFALFITQNPRKSI